MRWLERLVGTPDRPPDWKSRTLEHRVRVIAGEHFDELPTALSGPAAWLEPEDSLHVVEFVLALEEEFGIEIPDEDVETLHTLPEIITYMQQRLKPN